MIKEKIEKFYTDKKRDWDKVSFYVTDAGKCPRAVWFGFKKFPKKDKDPRVMRVFENGDYTHMRIMSSLFSIGAVKAIELALENELVRGRCDGIVVINNEPYVLELKSINSFAFKKLERPKPDHIKQLMLYLHYFKIQRGIFLYENKDTQELKEYMMTYDQKMAESIVQDFHTLKHFIESNTLPPVPMGLEEWECRFCDYSEECLKRQNASKAESLKKPLPEKAISELIGSEEPEI